MATATLECGGDQVPGLVNQDKLRALLGQNIIIKNGDSRSIEGVKYDFRIGPKFLKSKFRRPIDFDSLQNLDAISSAEIEPGEVVFVMTEEEISLPTNMMIVLTHKRKIAYDGILILGGLAVDPGYDGPLLIGLYNFSSRPYALTRYRKIIAGVFYQLSEEEAKDIKKLPTTTDIFPDDLVRLITNYQPVNLSGVSEKLSQLEGQFKILNDQITTSREWQEKFEGNLSKIQTETSKIQDETAKIAALLKEEVADRKGDTREIKDTMKRTEDRISEVDKKNAVVEERRLHNSRILWAIIALIAGLAGYAIRDIWSSRPLMPTSTTSAPPAASSAKP
jgi:deoxycytidine triphosphate deaminase